MRTIGIKESLKFRSIVLGEGFPKELVGSLWAVTVSNNSDIVTMNLAMLRRADVGVLILGNGIIEVLFGNKVLKILVSKETISFMDSEIEKFEISTRNMSAVHSALSVASSFLVTGSVTNLMNSTDLIDFSIRIGDATISYVKYGNRLSITKNSNSSQVFSLIHKRAQDLGILR